MLKKVWSYPVDFVLGSELYLTWLIIEHPRESHFSHTADLRTSIGPVQYIITSLFGPDPLPSSYAGNWKLNFSTSLMLGFTAEPGQELAEASVDVPYPPLQIVTSIPFCLFSLYLYPLTAPFSQISLFSLSTIPSFSSDQFFVLLR